MTFGIIANLDKSTVQTILPDLLSNMYDRKIPVVVTNGIAKRFNLNHYNFKSYSESQIGKHCNLVVAFGGDGTILAAARQVSPSGVPVLGVNVGRFGFLAEISVNELYDKLDELIAGEYLIEDRMALEALVISQPDHKKHRFFAFNDVVLDKGGFSRTILIETYINDEYLNTYKSDGIIICTPTGSTAYSLSAGGPLLTPDMQAMLINPICPHSLSQRPLIIRDDKVIQIKAWSEKREMLFSVDGRDVLKITEDYIIQVQRAEKPVKLVKCSGNSFYQVLRTKLNWGELPKKYFG